MLRTLENGRLDISSVDELSPDDLNGWIWRRLHGVDADAPDDPRQDVGQAYLVEAIYKDLLPGTQAEVRRILDRFLRQLAEMHEEWQGRPGDDLLLLVMRLGEPELAEPIRQMAEQGIFLQGAALDEERHARLVQALAYLGEKVTPEFWKEQLAHDPARYVALAFSGMLGHSLRDAFELLIGLELPADDLKAKLYISLRGLLASRRYNRDDVRKTVWEMSRDLPAPMVAFIREALPEIGAAHLGNGHGQRYAAQIANLSGKGFPPRCEPLVPDLAMAA